MTHSRTRLAVSSSFSSSSSASQSRHCRCKLGEFKGVGMAWSWLLLLVPEVSGVGGELIFFATSSVVVSVSCSSLSVWIVGSGGGDNLLSMQVSPIARNLLYISRISSKVCPDPWVMAGGFFWRWVGGETWAG